MVSILIFSCGEDDEMPLDNQAPGAFVVTATPSGNSVTLKWTAATDPDGDVVSYSVQLGGTNVPSNSSATEVTIDDLDFGAPYSGKVTASDPGGLSSTANFDFTTDGTPNEPPAAVVLDAPVADATNIGLLPELTWQSSVDSDGDMVSYDLYLGTNADPTTVVAPDLSATSFTVVSELTKNTSYYWKVLAKDGKGGETFSEIRSFKTKNEFAVVEATADAAFPDRYGHSTVVFQGKMWVIGGTAGTTKRNDVWFSEDGENWTKAVTSGTIFSPRLSHASVVFDDKIWVIGGYDFSTQFNDVWYSEDGTNWVEATSEADFEPRYSAASVVYNSKIWLLGGRDKDSPSIFSSRDVWSSADGINWNKETNNAGFSLRSGVKVVDFQDKMWKIGGRGETADKVYHSTNGIDWTLATGEANFGDRFKHTSVVYDNKIWLMGGADPSNETNELSDIWYTEDGETWIEAASVGGYGDRVSATSIVFDDKIWIIAGEAGFNTAASNDVWYLDFE